MRLANGHEIKKTLYGEGVERIGEPMNKNRMEGADPARTCTRTTLAVVRSDLALSPPQDR